jgi:ribosomal protein L12E/L44/L45/RPP1/RPP2
MQQLAGVNLSSFLQDISKLPAAVAGGLGAKPEQAKGKGGDAG